MLHRHLPSAVALALAVSAGCLDQPFATNVDLPLQVLQLTPTDGAVGVARDSAITAVFNLPVVEGSLKAGKTFKVVNVADADNPVEVDGSLEYIKPHGDAAPRAVFTPSALLPYSTPFKVTLTTGIERDGTPAGTLLKDVSAGFTTVDPPPLQVVSIVPASGASGVDPATTIAITFSEPVRCASVEAGVSIAQTFDDHPHNGANAGQTAAVEGTWACSEPASIEDIGCEDGACTVVFSQSTPPLALSSVITVSLAGGTRADGAVESFRSTDAGGQLPADVTSSFTVLDPEPLRLIASAPGTGSTDVALDTNLVLTFSEDLDCSTLTADDVTVLETLDDASVGSPTVTAAVSACDGASATLTFSRAFAYSATVDVTLAQDIESARATSRGGQLDGGALITFHTADPPPLLLVNALPANGATQVLLGTDLALTFSEALDCATVTPANITATEDLDPVVAGRLGSATVAHPVTVVSCAGADVVLSVDDFALSSVVTVQLAGAIASDRSTLSGGQLNDGAGVLYSFGTEHPTPMLVLSSNPGNGSTGIPVDTDLTVQFSEAVDCDTVVAAEGEFTLVESFSAEFLEQNPGSPTSVTHAATVQSCAGDTVVLAVDTDFQLASAVVATLPGDIASARYTSTHGFLDDGRDHPIAFEIIPFPPVEVVDIQPATGLIVTNTSFTVTFNQSIFVPVLEDADPSLIQVFLAATPTPNDPPDVANRIPLECVACQVGTTFTFRPLTVLPEGVSLAFVVKGGPDGVRGSVGGSIQFGDFVKRYLTVGGGLLVSTDPADGDTNVPVTQKLCAIFLVDVQAFLDADPDGFTVTATDDLGGQSRLNGVLDYAGVDPVTGEPDGALTSNRVCFTPTPTQVPCRANDELLPANTTVTMTFSFTDDSDPQNPQDVDEVRSFTTAGLPTLVDAFYETIPEINATGELTTEVPVSATLVLVFDQPVDAASAAAVHVETGAGVALAATATVTGAEVRLTPDANLAFNGAQRLRVDGGASAGLLFDDGRYLADDADFLFTTSPAAGVSISPIAGENALVTTVAPLVFSRPMFQPSLNTNTITARNNTASTVAEGAVATSIDDLFSAVFNPLPTWVSGTSVTLTIETVASCRRNDPDCTPMDFLGNPLPSAVAVTWASIQGAAAANSRIPDAISNTDVAPNAGAVSATQTFAVTMPTNNLTKLNNRMLPASFNDSSVIFEQSAPCALEDSAHIIKTENRLTVSSTVGGADVVTVRPLETLRAGCNYRLTLKQKFFSNIHTIGNDAASDIVMNFVGETTQPSLVSADVAGAGGGQAWVSTFSEPIDGEGLIAATVFDDTAAAPVNGSFQTSGNTVVFAADTLWRVGHSYTITFPTSVADLAGNTLLAEQTGTLTVEATGPTLLPPDIVATASNIITATFSEPVDPESVTETTFDGTPTAGTITVKDELANDVKACFTVSGSVVTITVFGAAPGATLTVAVGTGVTDLAGNPLQAPATTDVTLP